MTCKKCLHYKSCKMWEREINKAVSNIIAKVNNEREICGEEKTKPFDYTELEGDYALNCPCFEKNNFSSLKANQILYHPANGNISEFTIISIELLETGTIIRAIEKNTNTVAVCDESDINTKMFLSREQAEQALRERENE